MVRKALGRGLDSLIPGTDEAPAATEGLLEIEVHEVRPNPRQPRERFDPQALDAIAASLLEHGVLQPIVVRTTSRGGYELIAGERRWRAAQRAGLSRIPAVIRDVSPQESLELALVENLQREDLNAIEEAQAYQALLDDAELTQEQVAERVGRNRSTVSNYLRLLGLPDQVKASIISGDLSMGHARALLGLGDAAAQIRLGEEIVAKGLSVRQAEARVRSANRTGPTRRQATPDADVRAAEERLGRALGTPVRIKGKERGRVEIRFTSLEELDRLYELLLHATGRD